MPLNLTGTFAGNDVFNSARLNRVVQTLTMELDVGRPFTWLNRVPLVSADPTELVGRFTGRVISADLIMDDQVAVVQEGARLDASSYDVPNIKLGQKLGQRDMARLDSFERRGVTTGENAFMDWERKTAELLVLGVRMRMNYLAACMMLDTFSYNRLGVQSTGTWGKPAALKPSAYSDWAVAATGTPIADIRKLRNVAIDTYGIYYNRATMSTLALRYALATTEFKTAAQNIIGFAITAAAVDALPQTRRQEMLQQFAEVEIVVDDGMQTEKANDGTFAASRYVPAYKVILDRTDNDKNEAIWDFANTRVTESQMQAVRDMLPDVPADATGPIAYWTPAAHDANPPGQTAWAVARAFPRQFVPEASAVLTAGSFTS